MTKRLVHIVGGGLAGSEAAHFLAERGIQVHLHEMRPKTLTPAHKTGKLGELVCSNSLKSKAEESAPGVLKSEMNMMGSLILKAAAKAEVPGGQALTVDREVFSSFISETIESHENITRVDEEVSRPFEDGPTLFATGPLTSEKLSQWIGLTSGEGELYFYDAIAPVIDATTIDQSKVFIANRYDKGGEAAYINCPMNEEQYKNFLTTLLSAEKVPPNPFEKEKLFHGCQPIEAIAKSGEDSLRFGPMKPVGLEHPETGEKYYAIVQLRPENLSLTAYNMVGFQTKLKYGEQKRVFSMIPGLENVEFLRLGSIHRNTYVNGPRVLRPDLSLKGFPEVYLAGQVTGVEGYVESSAIGLLAGYFIWQRMTDRPHQSPPANTAMGSLLRYVTAFDGKDYQPNNIHFGLFENCFFEDLEGKKRDETRASIAKQSVQNFEEFWANHDRKISKKPQTHRSPPKVGAKAKKPFNRKRDNRSRDNKRGEIHSPKNNLLAEKLKALGSREN